MSAGKFKKVQGIRVSLVFKPQQKIFKKNKLRLFQVDIRPLAFPKGDFYTILHGNRVILLKNFGVEKKNTSKEDVEEEIVDGVEEVREDKVILDVTTTVFRQNHGNHNLLFSASSFFWN